MDDDVLCMLICGLNDLGFGGEVARKYYRPLHAHSFIQTKF